MEKQVVTPSDFEQSNITFGYFNVNGEFHELENKKDFKQEKIENHYKIHIGYKHNKIKHLKLTYDYSNINWKSLPKGIVTYNDFFDKNSKILKLDLTMNYEETYTEEFIEMLDSIRIICRKFMEKYYPKTKYKCCIKNVYTHKMNNIYYINNIKFKKSFSVDDENPYKSKIYMKTRVNNELTDELITNYEPLLKKYYRTITVIHLYGLYIKVENNIVNITQILYLEKVLFYKDKSLFTNPSNEEKSGINTTILHDDDYEI